MTQLTLKTVKTRKAHRCTWCGEQINVGASAQYRTGVWDGDFFSEYYHPECYDAMARSDDLEEFDPMDQLRGKTFEESHP